MESVENRSRSPRDPLMNTRNERPRVTSSDSPSRVNADARRSCVVCRAGIVDNHWFCRLPQNGNGESDPSSLYLLLCCPCCALRHFAFLHPRSNGFDPDNYQFERSIHLLVDGEKPPWL